MIGAKPDLVPIAATLVPLVSSTVENPDVAIDGGFINDGPTFQLKLVDAHAKFLIYFPSSGVTAEATPKGRCRKIHGII